MFGLRARDEARAIQATAWGDWGSSGGQTWAGTPVTTSSSLQLLTVYGCVRFIADGIATLPLQVYRGDGEQVKTPEWLEHPYRNLDRVSWLTQVLTSLLLDGNAYLWLQVDAGRLQLKPLDPATVTVRIENDRRVWEINGTRVDSMNLLHIPGIMYPGALTGLSPVEAARQSIGQGMAAQEFGAKFFSQGATMSGVIEAPAEMPPGATEEMAKAWARKHSGKSKSHLPGVLTGGATWKTTGVTNEQAQFLETRQFTAAEIAGQMFLIDPSELGIGVQGTSLTYANLEQRATRRVQVTYLPWIVRVENALSDFLARPRYAKFNVNGLLRGDTYTRMQTHVLAVAGGIATQNERRELEELPPMDGADVLFAPTTTPSGAEGDSNEPAL